MNYREVSLNLSHFTKYDYGLEILISLLKLNGYTKKEIKECLLYEAKEITQNWDKDKIEVFNKEIIEILNKKRG